MEEIESQIPSSPKVGTVLGVPKSLSFSEDSGSDTKKISTKKKKKKARKRNSQKKTNPIDIYKKNKASSDSDQYSSTGEDYSDDESEGLESYRKGN